MAAADRRRRRWFVALAAAVVVGVGVLAWLTLRTWRQIEQMREQSVVEATLSLANEKVERLDARIVEQDNVVIAETDPAVRSTLARRWLPTAARETRTVVAVLVIDLWSPGRDVVAYASRTGGGPQDDAFRRLVVGRAWGDLNLSPPADELRHLHRRYDGQSYLFGYQQRLVDGHPYLVVWWHDVQRIVRELLPVYADGGRAARVNVVDEDGRIVSGPPLRVGEFAVVRPFPTTLYGWRLQVSLSAAEELAASIARRRQLEIIMVVLSCLVVVAGTTVVLIGADRERRLSELKSDFVANVSHELKTPLALVRMFSELLLSGRAATDEKRREYLEIIFHESERLSALIENVLDFAKLEKSKSAFDLVPGDVGEAVAHAVELYRYRAEREGVDVELVVAPELPPALLDERAIGLAVINLLDNALKYARDGRHVGVAVGVRRGRIEVRVTDRGPGIPHDEQRRIFERFVRGRGGAEKQVRGSGIGLALVKHIAEVHGGRAWVESEPGEGATFVVQIPAVRPGDAPREPEPEETRAEVG